jgi:hypothetical protein
MQQALNRSYADRDKIVTDIDKIREDLERSQVSYEQGQCRYQRKFHPMAHLICTRMVVCSFFVQVKFILG